VPPQVETTDSFGGLGGRAKLGSITGRVELKGKTHGPVYVYVENIKEAAVDRHMEIVQRDRAFVPDAVIVQRGTRIAFPNADPVLHNVFSPSPTQPFDLGSYRQGEKAGVVRLFTPGVVEVFCNMHSKMHASVLVVPNRHYVKANPDGTFRLDNVPIGARQVSAWTPDARVASESVNLTPAGAAVNLSLQAEPHAHPMKDGRPYDPYRE
jgi:plastocyanin